jgi:DNA polymerase III psi subunit
MAYLVKLREGYVCKITAAIQFKILLVSKEVEIKIYKDLLLHVITNQNFKLTCTCLRDILKFLSVEYKMRLFAFLESFLVSALNMINDTNDTVLRDQK